MNRSRQLLMALAIALSILATSQTAAQTADAPGATPPLRLQPTRMLQSILSTTTADEAERTALDIRRARLGLSAQYGGALAGRLQVDLVTGSPSLVDAYLDVSPHPAARIRVGRAHRPFGLLERTSSSVILPIERGLRIRGVTGREHRNLITILEHAGREVGVQALATLPGALSTGVQAGIFFPEGAGGARFGARPDLSARVSVAPVPGLAVGASASHRRVEVADETESAAALALDAAYDRAGLRVMTELTGGRGAPLWEDDFLAGQVWVGYRLPFDRGGIRGIEPTGRVSHAAIEGAEAGTLLTPGVTFHLKGRDRVMVNYDHWQPRAAGVPSNGAAKVMLQLVL